MATSPELATPPAPQLDAELDAAALEAALPTLTEKLGSLSSTLTEDERAVLSSIVTSASLHLKELHSIKAEKAEAEYIYSKPISAAATPTIRERLLDLPEVLGFTE